MISLLHDHLFATAHRLPDQVALVCGEERVRYRELARRVSALAHVLVRGGVERGDRVIVYCENSVEACVGFWAALAANAVAVVIHAQTRPDKLAYYLADSRATALVTQLRLAAGVRMQLEAAEHLKLLVMDDEPLFAPALPRVPFPDGDGSDGDGPPARRCIDQDLAAIVYTSGSTGEPKGVMLTHRNMLAAAESVSTYLGMAQDDVVLSVLPLAFDYGLYQLVMCCRTGARLVLERSSAYPARLLERLVSEEVTTFPGVPTLFALLLELENPGAFDLSRIHRVTNTAAALPVRQIDGLRRLFPNARLFSMYGLTECKRCTYLPPEDLDRKPTSVGIPIPNTEAWVVDAQGRKLGPGQVGELVIRGATVMRGYWEKPEATARKLKPGPLPGELVLHTGDLVRMDEEGYVYFVARMDDVIKSRGEKVSPKEVETALMNIPGVREAAVIGVPDEFLGQAVKAFVVLEAGATLTPRAIQLECQRRLEPHCVPKTIVVVPELPKTNTGKIQKQGLC